MGNLSRLVESAVAVAAMIERDRDEGVPVIRRSVLVEGFDEPVDEPAALIVLVGVLESGDGFEDLAVGPIGGPGPFEMPPALDAIVTDE